MTTTLESLRREHAEVGIGPQLDDLLRRIVRATAPGYPPTEYSRAKIWNQEALEDVLQDWVSERLFGRRDLDVILSTAASLPVLRRALGTSLSQMIINQRVKSSALNLFKRSRRTLQANPQFVSPSGGTSPADQLWTLGTSLSSSASEQTIEALTNIAWELSDEVLEVVRYGPLSLKSSPILRDEGLQHLLSYVLGRADGALTLGQIVDVMKRRFNLVLPVDAELHDQLASTNLTPLQSVELEDLATSVLARMGEQRARVLKTFAKYEGDVVHTANGLGLNEVEVLATIREIMTAVAEYAESFEEAKSVYDRLSELVSESRF